MARKLELTWHKPTKRWKKFRNGKTYYFKFGESKSDMAGYKQALAAWREIEEQLDGAKPVNDSYQRAIALHKQRAEWYRRFGSQEEAAALEGHLQKIVELTQRASETNPPPVTQFDLPADLILSGNNWVWQDRSATVQRVKAQTDQARTVEANIKLFLERKRSNAEAGELSKGRCDILRLGLDRFSKHFGADRQIEELAGDCLFTFRDHLLTLASRGEFSRVYARDCLGSACQWIRWLWTSGRIEHLPRAIGSKELQVTVGSAKIKTFSPSEIKELLAEASEKMQLYILLSLNCGMTQKDIADLRKAEVNLKAGTIRRKRSKTNRQESVPEVVYHLWPRTLNLLKTHWSADKDLALVNSKGGPLWIEMIKDDGKLAKIDNIKTAYYRLVNHKKLKKMKGKPFKLFRKTSATLLAEHKDYKLYAQYFLGHSPRSVADRHYIVPSAEEFKRALTWLAGRYGIG